MTPSTPGEKDEAIVCGSADQPQKTRTPRALTREGLLASERNRWFLVTLLLCLITTVSLFSAYRSNVAAQHNVKVAWVKMAPNGTWDIDFFDSRRGPAFFQTTIDYLLRQFVERRYQEIPHSINADYGFVYTFMAPKLKSAFTSADGFNAAARAAEIAGSTGGVETHVTVRTIDHYDSDETRFGRFKGSLYRTNIFLEKTRVNPDGSMGKTTRWIAPVQWRIKSTEEITADPGLLETNPVGLEILDIDLLADVSK